MKATNILSLLTLALLVFACYVDVFGPEKSSSSYYSDSVPSLSSSSSQSIDVLLDSLHCEKQAYKVVRMGSQIWTAQNLNEIPKSGNSWCYGTFNELCTTHGRLYDWTAAKSVCPAGWKLPSKDDYDNLSDWDADILRATSVWHAAFGGLKYEDEDRGFDFLDKEGYWWSSTDAGDRAYYFSLEKGGIRLNRYDAKKTRGYSVRCIKK